MRPPLLVPLRRVLQPARLVRARASLHGTCMETPPRRDPAVEAATVAAAAAAQYAATAGDVNACTFVCISDTHCQHASLPPLPAGDVLLHAGDFTVRGKISEVLSFADWWHAQPHAQKIIIAGAVGPAVAGWTSAPAEPRWAHAPHRTAGNHDRVLEDACDLTDEKRACADIRRHAPAAGR